VGATDSKVYQMAMNDYYKKFVFRGKKRSAYSMKFRKFRNDELYEYMWGPSEFSATGTLKKWDGTSILKGIQCPILICCGQHDESTPDSNRRFAKMNPRSKLAVIPKASHSTFIENVEAIR
jgi:proline iminopeptidase